MFVLRRVLPESCFGYQQFIENSVSEEEKFEADPIYLIPYLGI